LEFDWDEHNVAHTARHDVTPGDVEQALSDPNGLAVSARHFGGEQRVGFIGATARGRVMVVIWTVRHNKVRVITARDASRKERQLYTK